MLPLMESVYSQARVFAWCFPATRNKTILQRPQAQYSKSRFGLIPKGLIICFNMGNLALTGLMAA